MYYSTVFLQSLGTIKNPFLMSLIFALMQIIATPWTFYLIERFGRRALLIYGALGMLVCEFIVAGVGSSLPTEKSAIVAVIAFICFVRMTPIEPFYKIFSADSLLTILVHLILRLDLGTGSLGCRWRDIPHSYSSARGCSLYRFELALEHREIEHLVVSFDREAEL